MEPHEIENRIRRLGAEPLPEHLRRLPHGLVSPMTRSGTRRTARRPLVAAAAVAVLALAGGVSFAAINSGPGPSIATSDATPEPAPPADVSVLAPGSIELPERPAPAQEPAREPARVRPFEDDPCKGPPPFAGRPPVGDTDEQRDANRAAEAAEHAEIRSNCPDDSDDSDDGDRGDRGGEGRSHRSFPFEDDPCKGPPSWVITGGNGDDGPTRGGLGDERGDAVDGPQRAEEARRHAEIRAGCGGDDGEGRRATGRPDHAGPPDGVPGGPPAGVPGGPRDGVPGGPPGGRPGGASDGDG